MVSEREYNSLVEKAEALASRYNRLVDKYNTLLMDDTKQIEELNAKVRYWRSIADAWQKTLLKLIDAFSEVGEKGADTNGSE